MSFRKSSMFFNRMCQLTSFKQVRGNQHAPIRNLAFSKLSMAQLVSTVKLLLMLLVLVPFSAHAANERRFEMGHNGNSTCVFGSYNDESVRCFMSETLSDVMDDTYTALMSRSDSGAPIEVSSGFAEPGVIANTVSYTFAFNMTFNVTEFQIGEFKNNTGGNYVFTPDVGTPIILADDSDDIAGAIATLNPVDWLGTSSFTVSYTGGDTWRLGLDNLYFTPAISAPAFTNLNNDSAAWADIGNTLALDVSGDATVSDTELDALNGAAFWRGCPGRRAFI